MRDVHPLLLALEVAAREDVRPWQDSELPLVCVCVQLNDGDEHSWFLARRKGRTTCGFAARRPEQTAATLVLSAKQADEVLAGAPSTIEVTGDVDLMHHVLTHLSTPVSKSSWLTTRVRVHGGTPRQS